MFELKMINDRDPESAYQLFINGVYRLDVSAENVEDVFVKWQHNVIDAELMLKEEREKCSGNCRL